MGAISYLAKIKQEYEKKKAGDWHYKIPKSLEQKSRS
jgi:hypothetical protein